jgi:hypothetical protein
MTSQWTWFTVRLALVGLSETRAPKVIRDLRQQLAMRPHLRNPRVEWDSKTSRAIVQIDTEDEDPVPAAKQMQEEMLEALAAVLWETEGLRFEILDARPTL